jgi:hypothetical protein
MLRIGSHLFETVEAIRLAALVFARTRSYPSCHRSTPPPDLDNRIVLPIILVAQSLQDFRAGSVSPGRREMSPLVPGAVMRRIRPSGSQFASWQFGVSEGPLPLAATGH